MRPRFPQRYAAASLKRPQPAPYRSPRTEFSAAICCGLIEAGRRAGDRQPGSGFSAAICCGLIEAQISSLRGSEARRFSAAICCGLIEALQQAGLVNNGKVRFSAAICCGLIEARSVAPRCAAISWFSAAICCGLIEAERLQAAYRPPATRFPQRYAAASLKLRLGCGRRLFRPSFPQRYAAASLKRPGCQCLAGAATLVFRSDMLRPH